MAGLGGRRSASATRRRRFLPKEEAYAAVEGLASRFAGGAATRQLSLRILFGSLYGLGPEVKSTRLAMQEVLVRRMVVLLTGVQEKPFIVIWWVYTCLGVWQATAFANRVVRQSGQKVAATIFGSSTRTLYKGVFGAWAELVQSELGQAAAMSKIAATMLHGMGEALQHAVLSEWHRVAQEEALEAVRLHRETRLQEVHMADALKHAAMVLNGLDRQAKKECFAAWQRDTAELKQRLQSALQIVGIMMNGQGMAVVREIFTDWAGLVKGERDREVKIRRIMQLFACETQALQKMGFEGWHKLARAAREKMQKNLRYFAMSSGSRDRSTLGLTFNSWRKDVKEVIAEKHKALELQRRQEALLQSIQVMMQGNLMLLVANVIRRWRALAGEEKLKILAQSEQSRALRKSMQVMLSANDDVLISSAFHEWRNVLVSIQNEEEAANARRAEEFAASMAEKQELETKLKTMQLLFHAKEEVLESAAFHSWKSVTREQREQNAARDQKIRLLAVMLNNNAEHLVASFFTAWSRFFKEDQQNKKNQVKAVHLFTNLSESSSLRTGYNCWKSFHLECQRRIEREEAATRAAAIMSAGKAASHTASFKAWAKYARKVATKVKQQTRLLAKMTGGDLKALCSEVFHMWTAVLREKRRLEDAQRRNQQKQEATAQLVMNWQGMSLTIAWKGWKELVLASANKRKRGRHQETMAAMLGGRDALGCITFFFSKWQEFLVEARHDAEITKLLEMEESVKERRSWASGKVMQSANTGLLLRVFLRYAQVVAATRARSAVLARSKVNQHVRVMNSEFLNAKINADRLAKLAEFLNCWYLSVSITKADSERRLTLMQKGIVAAAGSSRLFVAVCAWTEAARSFRRQRRVVRAGLARWLAAGLVLVVSFAFRNWQGLAFGARRRRLQEAAQNSAAATSELRSAASKAEAGFARAFGAAESLAGKLLAKARRRRLLATPFRAWLRLALSDASSVRERHREAAAERSAGAGDAAGQARFGSSLQELARRRSLSSSTGAAAAAAARVAAQAAVEGGSAGQLSAPSGRMFSSGRALGASLDSAPGAAPLVPATGLAFLGARGLRDHRAVPPLSGHGSGGGEERTVLAR